MTITQIKLLSAQTESAAFDVFLTTDKSPGVSVVRDDGKQITATNWQTIREALAFLVGAGCEIDAQTDNRQLIDEAVTAKYAALR